jgi:hypothetical protein
LKRGRDVIDRRRLDGPRRILRRGLRAVSAVVIVELDRRPRRLVLLVLPRLADLAGDEGPCPPSFLERVLRDLVAAVEQHGRDRGVGQPGLDHLVHGTPDGLGAAAVPPRLLVLDPLIPVQDQLLDPRRERQRIELDCLEVVGQRDRLGDDAPILDVHQVQVE